MHRSLSWTEHCFQPRPRWLLAAGAALLAMSAIPPVLGWPSPRTLPGILGGLGGFLQGAKVIDVPAAAALIWMFPLVCVSYGLAKAVVARRYR